MRISFQLKYHFVYFSECSLMIKNISKLLECNWEINTVFKYFFYIFIIHLSTYILKILKKYIWKQWDINYCEGWVIKLLENIILREILIIY